MASFNEAPIVELGKQAIGGSARCGRDIADDPEFLTLDAELTKLDRIDLGEANWYEIEKACLSILSTKSKDVEVACALGLALFKKQRYAGLAASLALLHELIKNFWDDLFPTRPRRRKARVEALSERFGEGTWVRDNPPSGDDFDAIDHCVERIEALKTTLTEKMPDDPPDFAKFTRKMKELAATRPKAAPAAAPAGAPAGGEGAAGAPAGGAAAFQGGEVKDASSALKAILAAATFMRQADPTDPLPYALVRYVKWASAALPATEAAKRQIEPPEKSLSEALPHQLQKGLWDHLLKTAEGAFRASDPLWLDLQRYVCAALKGLGTPFDRARTAVMEVTGGLLRRLGPGLYELAFRDGTPLCSGETRMWLEAEVVQGPSGGGRAGGAGGSNGKLEQAAGEARKLAGAGNLPAAVKTLQGGLDTCTQRRDRFLWRLRIAQLCFDAGRLQLAAPLLEGCYAEIQRYHIDEWEPSLAVEVAQTLYRCRKALTTSEKQPSAEALESVRDSYAWLCQLDPLTALAAEPAGK